MRNAKLLKIIPTVLSLAVLLAAGYCAFVFFSYHRLGDVRLSPENNAEISAVSPGTVYSVTCYNIGFGAYSRDYSCVMDSCYVPTTDGAWKKVKGLYLKAFSEEDARRNTKGAADTIAALKPDFAFFQEVDVKSDRCYGINQAEVILEALGKSSSVFCINFDMPFLAYPLNDMMGAVKSGLLTVSSVSIAAAERYEFEVTSDRFSRLFDLDRCFSVSYINADNGKQLVLVNLHMSAYDEGGVIRTKQRKQLYGFIEQQYKQGNYVIAGGDFNHDLLTNNPDYPEYTDESIAFADDFEQKLPDNVAYFFDDNKDAELPQGFRVVAADNAPTCRTAAISWQPGFSYIRTLDGFIVSDNITVKGVENIVTSAESPDGFAYSDHEPVYMSFELLP